MTLQTVPTLADARTRGAEYLDRARQVAEIIEAEANAIEEQAALTQPVLDALIEAGLFLILIPEEYGGAGLDSVSYLKIVQEISRADGSAGWAFMANAGSMGVAAGFTNPEGAKELFGGDNKAITAGMVVPTGSGVKVEGGYRVSGRFQFASGSAHASWIGAGFITHDDDGNPVTDADGQPDARIAWIPREQVEFLGNWDVMGMKGTGSYDYQVSDQFVPERFTMSAFSTTPVRPEAVYKIGLTGLGIGSHAPVALGLAERALQEIAKIAAVKSRPGYDGPIGNSDLFRIDFARHEAMYRAAYAYVYEVFDDAERTAANGQDITAEQRARLLQAATWVQDVSSDIVQFAHRWAGSTTVRNPSEKNPSPLGRILRDSAVATQHALIDRMTLSGAAEPIMPRYQNG